MRNRDWFPLIWLLGTTVGVALLIAAAFVSA